MSQGGEPQDPRPPPSRAVFQKEAGFQFQPSLRKSHVPSVPQFPFCFRALVMGNEDPPRPAQEPV